MADSEYKRLIRAAQEAALIAFMAAMRRALQDIEKHVPEPQSRMRPDVEQAVTASVRRFLREDGDAFLHRIEVRYRNYLERAMQTMYVDFRPGMRKLSAEELSLVDDDAVHHQLEVSRLAQRIREENEEGIGRLNVIVAQMHGEREARERENPFRPYLAARALYEAVGEVVPDPAKAVPVLDRLSGALIEHLPGYYSAIRDVFESAGMHGKFQAQQSRMVHHQRYFGAPPGEPAYGPGQPGVQVLPGLQRLIDQLHARSPETDIRASKAESATAPEFIRGLIGRPAPYASFSSRSLPQASPARDPSSNEWPSELLLSRLNRAQAAAGAQGALQKAIDLTNVPASEQMTVEVVCKLFEYIERDEMIPAALRPLVARLRIPVLKAMLLQPALMHEERHPARGLLNRLATAAVDVDPTTPSGQRLATEIERVTGRVLKAFEEDPKVFALCLQEFESFLADHLRCNAGATTLAVEAMETAERFDVLWTDTAAALRDVLSSLHTDQDLSDFVVKVWSQVLVQAAFEDARLGVTVDRDTSRLRLYRAVLPELLWSIQDKPNAHEHGLLVRLLPDLVRRVRKGMESIRLPHDEVERYLDQLMVLHSRVLRSLPQPRGQALPALEYLRGEFSRVAVYWERDSRVLPQPPALRPALVAAMLADCGAPVKIKLPAHPVPASAADREFLSQVYLPGICVVRGGPDGGTARLVSVSRYRSLYLFRQENSGELTLYSFTALLDALRNGELVPLEPAPVFDRAVERLLLDDDDGLLPSPSPSPSA